VTDRQYDPIQADVVRGRHAAIIAMILVIVAALCCGGFLWLAAWNADKDWWPELTPSVAPSEEVTYDWFPE
jgi:autotransporter translocation and assembly factor TamB